MHSVTYTIARPDTGAVLPYAVVTVLQQDGTTRASLYNGSGTPIGNPITADSNGVISFAAANGTYIMNAVSADGTQSLPNIAVQVFDLAALAAAIAAGSLAGVIGAKYETEALRNADLAKDAGTIALVYGDSEPLKNDLSYKIGASGSGSWSDPLGLMAGLSYAQATRAVSAADAAAASFAATAGILDARGVAVGETGDPAIAAAYSFLGDGRRTWWEVGWDGKPTPYSARCIAQTFNFSALGSSAVTEFNSLVGAGAGTELTSRGVAVGETGDPAIAMADVFSDGRRTFREVGWDGRPTPYSARLISQSINFGALSTEQVNDLAERLPASASAVLPVPLDTAPQGAGREYPTVRKPLTAPIFTHANQDDADADVGAESVYWPFFFDLTQIGGSGVALFYSTDHAATFALSGIYLATADTPEGPYTFHGRIFQDAVVGVQTETPSVMYDAVTDKVMLYYQEAPNAHQATFLATADPADFLTAIIDGDWSAVWTRYAGDGASGEVLGWATTEAGDGHTGYLKPFRYGGQWHGHSLFGGGTVGRFGYWQSRDGYTWRADPRRYGRAQHLIDHITGFASDYNAKIYNGAVINWNGNPWWIGLVGGSAAGGLSVDHRICTAPFGSDFARLGARVVDVTPATQVWEGGKIDGFGNAITWEGRVYAAYRAGGQQGGFGLLEIVL